MTVYCTEISTINQFKNWVLGILFKESKSHSAALKKTDFDLDVSKNCTILKDFDLEDGINPKDVSFLVMEVDIQEESGENSSWNLGK